MYSKITEKSRKVYNLLSQLKNDMVKHTRIRRTNEIIEKHTIFARYGTKYGKTHGFVVDRPAAARR